MASSIDELSVREINFARMVVRGGVGMADCYRRSGYKASTYNAARQGAYALKERPRVAKYIKELQQGLHKRTRMSLERQLEILEEIIETPVGEIDEFSPLASEVSHNAYGKTVKTMSKEKAMEMHARMTGNFKSTIHLEANQATISLLSGVTHDETEE